MVTSVTLLPISRKNWAIPTGDMVTGNHDIFRKTSCSNSLHLHDGCIEKGIAIGFGLEPVAMMIARHPPVANPHRAVRSNPGYTVDQLHAVLLQQEIYPAVSFG